MQDNNRHLDDILYGQTRTPVKECDADAVNLEELEKEYRAAGLIQPKGQTRLHILRGKEPVISMQYVHLDSHSEYTPTRFKVTFAGTKTWAVVVSGRNLWEVYDAVTRHCCPWIRAADRDLGVKDGTPFIGKIEIAEVKEER